MPNPTQLVAQSAYTQARASMTYAQSREEALGYVELACSKYQALSQAQHVFLSFSVYLGPRDLGIKGCLKDSSISAQNMLTLASQKWRYSQECSLED